MSDDEEPTDDIDRILQMLQQTLEIQQRVSNIEELIELWRVEGEPPDYPEDGDDLMRDHLEGLVAVAIRVGFMAGMAHHRRRITSHNTCAVIINDAVASHNTTVDGSIQFHVKDGRVIDIGPEAEVIDMGATDHHFFKRDNGETLKVSTRVFAKGAQFPDETLDQAVQHVIDYDDDHPKGHYSCAVRLGPVITNYEGDAENRRCK
jgi:hypothetical protein